jgi:hypothetical protein
MVDDVDAEDADTDDADYARRLLAARVPELTEAQIAETLATGMSAEFAELSWRWSMRSLSGSTRSRRA